MSCRYASVALYLCAFSVSLSGCSNPTSNATSKATMDAAIAANLSAADKLDGSEDHVVEKCYACALEMDGAPNISTKYHDYTVRHCSEACKERFVEKADSIVAGTKMPAAKGQHAEETGTKSE